MDMFLSDSDWESSTESGSSVDLEEAEYLYGGQASCILTNLEQAIGKIDEFLSFEREFMFGDIVCSMKDPSGQMGKVIGIDMQVDLETSHGTLLKDVNSKDLLKVRSFSVGDFVVYGPWIGRVEKVIDSVSVLFDDGTKCEIIATDHEKLLPVSTDGQDDLQYPYYPGQRIRLSNVSKPPRWLSGRNPDQNEATVCSVEAGLVSIDWIASVIMDYNSSSPAPLRLQDAKNLTLLSCFPHVNWHLGDWCIFPMDEKNIFSGKKFTSASTHDHIEIGLKGTGFQEISVIVKKKTKVDVLWQDSSVSLGLDSQILGPVHALNAYEFWPQQIVMEKSTCDDANMLQAQRWGVVEEVDAKERMVKVHWENCALTGGNGLNGLLVEETMSAYELVEHPDFSFSLGDIVFRLELNKPGSQSDKNIIRSATFTNEEAAQNGAHITDKKMNLDIYLSCIGNVTGFKDGAVEVRWANCSTSMVSPQEIFPINKNEVSTTTLPDGENVELREYQIESLKQYDIQNELNLPSNDDADHIVKRSLKDNATYFFPQAAMRFFSGIFTTLFGQIRSKIPSGTFSALQIFEGCDEIDVHHEKEVLQACGQSPKMLEIAKLPNSSLKTEEIHEHGGLTFSASGESGNEFRRFDIATNCPDHHFLATGEGSALSQTRKGWSNKVQQEWRILEHNLPETIYVRVFEERMDLIRAVLIGASGTPYHDGLFFFDIFLLPEYPQKPPLVHYISGGFRVNPNLYESGKVCLSLLNTWTGTGSEVWNPGNSTILQVLLSLQALVLNEKPYYNEAGYDTQLGRADGERNSVSYNENAFLTTCKSMLFLLNNPPKHFEALVEEHFKRRFHHILAACKAYMEGLTVGCDYHFEAKVGQNQNKSSTGFKIMLAKIFPKLVMTFSSKGIDCSPFMDPEKVMLV